MIDHIEIFNGPRVFRGPRRVITLLCNFIDGREGTLWVVTFRLGRCLKTSSGGDIP